MKRKKFRIWVNEHFLKEMATFNFGGHKDKDHTNVPEDYLQWMQGKLQGGANYNVSDNGRRLSSKEQQDLVASELQRRSGGAVRGTAATQATQATSVPRPRSGAQKWIAATSLKIPGIKPQDPVAMLQTPNGWQYMDKDGNMGQDVLPSNQIANYVTSIKDANGKQISSNDPVDLFSMLGIEMETKGGNVGDQQNSVSDEFSGGSKGRPTPEEVRLPPEHMTPYNQAIQDKFLKTEDNIMIDALAGTGKTTMLKHLASFIKPGEKWLYLVYNTKNRDEATEEFPVGRDENGNTTSTVTVMTTHGFLGDMLKNVDPTLGGNTRLPKKGQEDKIRILADRITPKNWPETAFNSQGKSPFNGKAKFKAIALANLAKAYAFDPQDPNIAQNILKIVEDYNVDMDCSLSYAPKGLDPSAAQAVQNLSEETIKEITIQIIQQTVKYLQATLPGNMPEGTENLGWLSKMRDQDDTLWYTAIYADKMNWKTQYDVVLMDEVQDFNMCQMIMAKKLKESGSRVVAVGDPNQSMYRFRGADSAAFDKLKAEIGQGESMSLPINFRSGGNIIDWVRNNTHVKDLQASPHLEGQGEVWADGGTHSPIGYDDFMGMVVDEWTNTTHKDEKGNPINGGRQNHSTAMIARNNAPLAVAAIQFLKSGVDFEIVGLDLSKELIGQIEEIVKDCKDESENPLYVTWGKTKNGKPFPVADFSAVPLEAFMGNIVADFSKKRTAMWQSSASKQDKLKSMRSAISILGFIWTHIQDENSMDEEAKKIKGGTVQNLIDYLKMKLGGKDPDKKEDMDLLSKKDPKSYITLTTAHKSKGLEWERVFLMQPGAYNPEGEKIRTEEDAQQERNSWYVAGTRGKQILMVSSDEEPQASSEKDSDGEDFANMFKMMFKR